MQDQYGNNVRVWRDEDLEYRVIELSMVTDAEIEQAINRNVVDGWTFDSMHFAMWEGSKRPAMAFLMFIRLRPTAEPGTDAAN